MTHLPLLVRDVESEFRRGFCLLWRPGGFWSGVGWGLGGGNWVSGCDLYVMGMSLAFVVPATVHSFQKLAGAIAAVGSANGGPLSLEMYMICCSCGDGDWRMVLREL